ncbi:MAG: hypothetical protein KGL68_11115 [Burkholderiales bacterium]|nr:hypothetical protein [Burkholderiales bacterium]
MPNLSSKLREWLRAFLGLHPTATLSGESFYDHLAHRLMYVPRVFGSRERLHVGEGVVLNDALINTSSGSVTLNDHAFCGHGVSLLTGTHDYHKRSRERQTTVPEGGRDIVVGKGAWIGSNVTVLGPCVIGEHAVVAAGSVVVSDIEPMSVYAGVPARKIKTIAPPIT